MGALHDVGWRLPHPHPLNVRHHLCAIHLPRPAPPSNLSTPLAKDIDTSPGPTSIEDLDDIRLYVSISSTWSCVLGRVSKRAGDQTFQFALAHTMDGYRVLDLVGEGSFGKVRRNVLERREKQQVDTC